MANRPDRKELDAPVGVWVLLVLEAGGAGSVKAGMGVGGYGVWKKAIKARLTPVMSTWGGGESNAASTL